MMVWGNLIDAEQAAREAGRGGDSPDLVPPSWQLVRRDADGRIRSVAGGVLSFDVGEDGALVFTNGSAVYSIGRDAARTRLCADHGIEQVIVVAGA